MECRPGTRYNISIRRLPSWVLEYSTEYPTGDLPRLIPKFALAISWRFAGDLFQIFAGLSVSPWILPQLQRQGGEVITEGSGMHSLIRCVGLIDYSPHVHFDREFQYWYTCTRIYLYSCMYCTSTGYQYICEIGVWSCPCKLANSKGFIARMYTITYIHLAVRASSPTYSVWEDPACCAKNSSVLILPSPTPPIPSKSWFAMTFFYLVFSS